MASVLGVLEEREAAARARVEDLRAEAARLAEVLEAAEIELDRRVIAREELVEALTASADGPTDTVSAGVEAVLTPAPVSGSVVPPRREGLPATVLTADYQRILDVVDKRHSAEGGPVRAKEVTRDLGLDTVPAKVEGVRSKARRLAERGWLVQETCGAFSPRCRSVAGPGGAPSV